MVAVAVFRVEKASKDGQKEKTPSIRGISIGELHKRMINVVK